MEKAYAYLRVSGKGQIDGDGFPRQLKAIRTFADAQKIRVTKVFREEGISGTTENMNRPAWCALMEQLQATGMRIIMIEKLDRLARDLMVQEACIADLHKRGFALLSASEPDLMANDPTRILMRQLLGAVAQYDKSQIVAKLRCARVRCRERDGRCEGRKPFGHRVGENAVIARMKALRAEGKGYDRIADSLNAEGVPTRTGRRWHGIVVNRILSKLDS